MVRERVFLADHATTARLAGDCAWRIDADAGADGKPKNARRVSLVPESPDVFPRAGTGVAMPPPLYLAAQGACPRARAPPSRAALGGRRRRPCTQSGDHLARDRDSHG